MDYVIEVENIRCEGCASAIREALGKLDGVQTVSVDIASGQVSVLAGDGMREQLCAALQAAGYPEK